MTAPCWLCSLRVRWRMWRNSGPDLNRRTEVEQALIARAKSGNGVRLAMDLDRTPLQTAAKRVYHELVSAEAYAMDAAKHLDCDLAADRLRRFNAALETAFDAISLLMHEGDCE